MPQIIVTADGPVDGHEAPVMLRERVNLSDFESDHFANHLVERLGWAVEDAHELQQQMRSGQPDEQDDSSGEAYAPARVLTTAS